METYLPSETNFIAAATIPSSFLHVFSDNNKDEEIQCDLMIENEELSIDPTRLSYKERLRWHIKEFCYKTSIHGVPMLEQAPNNLYRCVWIVLLISCACMFLMQAVSVVAKYNRNEKITNIELKFDTALFPAITICNLNPYRDSTIRNVKTVEIILKVFNDIMTKAGLANRQNQQETLRKNTKGSVVEVAYKLCNCSSYSNGSISCKPSVLADDNVPFQCICAFDQVIDNSQLCYPKEQWTSENCSSCNNRNICTKPKIQNHTVERKPCLCHPQEPMCILQKEPVELREYSGEVMYNMDKIKEALGFQNMNDEVAIVTKARENIIFAMSELSANERIELSHNKRELIQKCSFNGAECNIDKDFRILSDPLFGNCFTFNHNRTENKTNLRAGPMYGLRLLLYVNASDYLPTTEAVGVRITVHDKDEYPFPDTFGYSAPTGSISSFGMKMGCYHSCFQEMIVRECGCGDPRFPVPHGLNHCPVFDEIARKCIQLSTNMLSNLHGSIRCRCQQPCTQSLYTVSYSESLWPSQSLNVPVGTCDDTPERCIEQYQENGAMVEVFYDALNFEMFSESEAYGVVKMLSDFGGQLGLWSGVSFITLCEFVCLLIELLYMFLSHHIRELRHTELIK